jgi:hypothetical protein
VSTSAAHKTEPVEDRPVTFWVPLQVSAPPSGRYAPSWWWSERATVVATPFPAKFALKVAPFSRRP